MPVTRAQIAAFIARVHEVRGYTLPEGRDAFTDDDTSVHEPAINSLAEAGVIAGTSATTFSPQQAVSRGQATALMARIVDLQIEQGRVGWPLPANQLFAVDPAGEQFRNKNEQPSTITLTASRLTPGTTYSVTLASQDDVDGNPPAIGPVRFADANGDGAADLRGVEAYIVEINGRPHTRGNTATAVANANGQVVVVVDNDMPNPAVLVVYEPNANKVGLQVDKDGTAAQPFGVSGDLVWFVPATPASAG
jgi:hypothetical protein